MPTSAKTDTVRELAKQHDWPHIMAIFETQESGKALLDIALVLEDLATQHLEAQEWFEAAMCSHLGQWPVTHGAGIAFSESPAARRR